MKYISKRFLSDKYDETGSMVVKVRVPELEDMGSWQAENASVEASIELRDCNGKPIWLEFCMDNENSLEDRLAKLDLMINELTEMKVKLQEARLLAFERAGEWERANPDYKSLRGKGLGGILETI